MNLSVWLAFLVACILIAVTPGAGAVTSISTGLRHGVLAALRAIAGLQTALTLQLIVVAAGLGALLATSATAFLIVKLLGAAYLIWLGWQKWRAPPVPLDSDPASHGKAVRGLYLQGILVNLTNPKAIVFIAALVPQFIDPQQPQLPQFVIIGLTMCGVDTIVMTCYASLASRLRPWLRDPRALKAQNRFFGAVFALAGTLLAFSSRPT